MVDASLTLFVKVFVTCTTFGAGFIRGFMLLSFIAVGVFSAVVGDLCCNGIVSIGFWVVFACFPAILACDFLVPVVVPFLVVVLWLKYAQWSLLLGNWPLSASSWSPLLLLGVSHRPYSFSYSKV